MTNQSEFTAVTRILLSAGESRVQGAIKMQNCVKCACLSPNRRTPAIDPEILRTMVVRHSIGYAPNPGTRKRNQVLYRP